MALFIIFRPSINILIVLSIIVVSILITIIGVIVFLATRNVNNEIKDLREELFEVEIHPELSRNLNGIRHYRPNDLMYDTSATEGTDDIIGVVEEIQEKKTKTRTEVVDIREDD